MDIRHFFVADTQWLLTTLAFAFACMLIAIARNRNPTAWFFAGGSISIVGIIMLLALPALEADGRLVSKANDG